MRTKKFKLLAGTLATALVISTFSTNYVSAEIKHTKSTSTVKKAKVKVVKSVGELNKALKNKSVKNINLKTDKKVKLNLTGDYKSVKLVIDAPKAEVKNNAKFKIIEINANKWVENTSGNGLVIKTRQSGIEIGKKVKVKFIRFAFANAKAGLKIDGDIDALFVQKKADIKISGKTDIVFVTVNADGTKIESSTQLVITANKNIEAVFKKGAEGSTIKATNDKVSVIVKNNTKEEVYMENSSGKDIILANGNYLVLKDGKSINKGEEETLPESTVSLNVETTPLGVASGKILEIAGTVADGSKNYSEPASKIDEKNDKEDDEDNYAPIEDKLLLKVINKNIDKNRADDQRVTKEEMASLKAISIFLDKDGKPAMSQEDEFLNDDEEETSTPKDSILGKPRSLRDTPDFKFMVSRGIKSIKGLEYAVNLEKIKLNENEIADISPLKNLKKLRYIELQRNRIVDLTPLAGLTELRYLKLYNNLIEDVTPLAGLTELRGLDLHYNVTVTKEDGKEVKSKGITDVSVAIKNMKELVFLDLSANRINNVKGIENLTLIRDLDLSGNCISDYRGAGDFLAERYAKIADEEEGWSLNFAAQTIELGETIYVLDGKAEFDNPFLGIDELDSSLSKLAGEDMQFFMKIKAQEHGDDIKAEYDKAANKFKLEISDKLIEEVKLQGSDEITVPFEIVDLSEIGFTMNNVKLKFVEKSGPELEENGKVYRKYDLREQNAVTKIKNQFRDGGCRSFAALGALESHIKLKTGVELDLSENNFENRHGFYFNTNNVRSGRNRNSDIPYLVNNGPILEEDDPYIPMKGVGGESHYLTQEQVNAAAKKPVEKAGVKQIMGFNFLKTIDVTRVDSAEADELLQIKEAIVANGGVAADMYMAHDGNKTFPYTDVKYYNTGTKAYYFDDNDSDRASKYKPVETDGVKYGANHAITIVGWDDDFSKDNFITKPEIDGAWIVRDAQSEAFGDNGYFYVSFKSVSMVENPYVFTEVIDSQYGIYQHDEVAFTGYRKGINFDTGEKDVLFNRYKAKGNSNIEKVGFYTTKKNAEYEVYLIPDFNSFESEARGLGGDDAEEFYELIQEYKVLAGTAENAGYLTLDIPVDKAINLSKGKDFAVGIWTKNSDEEDPEHKYDMVVEEKNIMNNGKNTNVGKKETYIYDKEEGFMDLNQYTNANGPVYPINACIKAYYKK